VSVALDTNVIVEVVGGTQDASKRTIELLREHGARSRLVISPVVYAELLAHPAWRAEDVAEFLNGTGVAVDWELPESVWTRAGEAFASYAKRRRRHEAKSFPRRLLSDFVIGSHAVEIGTLMTGDVGFFRRNFPELRIVAA
jgi:predicted nucleic acid-binding protein